MEAVELRKKWLQSIAKVDERFLRMVDALYESYITNEADYTISSSHKKTLDTRLKNHKDNPALGKDWEVVKEELTQKYGS
ncbi:MULTISPECIES: addiction module protein [unclassified Lacinutrix]